MITLRCGFRQWMCEWMDPRRDVLVGRWGTKWGNVINCAGNGLVVQLHTTEASRLSLFVSYFLVWVQHFAEHCQYKKKSKVYKG